MSFRAWLTIITFMLVGLVVFFAWPEIIRAWEIIGGVNIWILALLLPVQILSYYAVGEIIFTYIRRKGELKQLSHWKSARMAFELNFVNHVLPSGGAAGFSYMGWILGKHGVTQGRAALAQLIRFVLSFGAFITLLLVSVLYLTLDHQVNRVTLFFSLMLTILSVGATIFLIYLISGRHRHVKFADRISRFVNRFVRTITFNKVKSVLDKILLEKFFIEMHDDYLDIKNEKKMLKKPFAWALVAIASDAIMYYVVFLALGYSVSPAILLIAFGAASSLGFLSVTPGGAGVFEAVMIAFLATSGVPPESAIAGTLLTRVLLVLGTIVFGYVFYQLTIMKYGKKST